MSLTPVVIIKGIPGSGKTWICREIQKMTGVVCFDVDDIYTLAYEQLVAKKQSATHVACADETSRMLELGISRARSDTATRLVVISSGITIPFNIPGEKLFVGLSAKSAKVAHARVLRRQLDRWHQSKPPSNLEGDDLANWVRAHHLVAMIPSITLERYRQLYSEEAAKEQNNGYKILSQSKIVEYIRGRGK
jgi:cytidylate kinase